MHAIVLLFILAAFQVQEDLPVLRPVNTIQGTIEDVDPVVQTEILDKNYTQAPTLGKRYIIKIEEPGAYTIDLKSVLFDTYLVLRNTAEDVLAEDDDGLYGTHSRIVFESTQRESVYYIEACALHGARGDYELCLAKGHLPELSPLEKQSAALRDAREKVRIIEVREGEESPVLASALNDLATLIGYQGNYKEQRLLLERSLKIYEQEHGPEHQNTARNLNNLASSLMSQGKLTEAKPLLERALRIQEQALGSDHTDVASSLNKLAWVLQTQRRYDEAKPLLERALRIYEQNYGPVHQETALTLSYLAGLLGAQGRYDQAKSLYERTLRIYEHILGSEHTETARTLEGLAKLLKDQGHYDEAKPLLERALRIREQRLGTEHPWIALTLKQLAGVLEKQGRYDEARPHYERALRIKEQEPEPDNLPTAAILSNLAGLLARQGNLDEARPLFERALLNIEQQFGPTHLFTASALNNLAWLLFTKGEYNEAKWLYERALRIHEQAPESENASTATCLNNLGNLLVNRGHYDEAKPLLERALRIKEQLFGPENPETAVSLDSLGILLVFQGHYDEAKPLFERTFRIQEKVLGTEHPDTVKTLNDLVLLHTDLGNLKEAWALSQRAIASSETNLIKLLWSLSEHERFLYVAQKLSTLKKHLTLSKSIHSIESEKTAYEALLRWKGRVSRSLFQTKEQLSRNLKPEAREVLGRLERIQSQLSKELYTTEIKNRKVHEGRVNRLRKERLEMETELARLAGHVEDKAIPSLTEIQAALPDGSKILDFFVHEWHEPAVIEEKKIVKKRDWTPPHLSVWISGKDKDHLEHIDLGPAETIHQAVKSYLENLVAQRGGPPPEKEESPSLKQANDTLRALLWNPIAEHVGEAETLLVSPDSFLGTFPFEVLQLEDGTHLIEHHAFDYLQDVGSLVLTEERPKEDEMLADVSRVPPSVLVVGDVDYQTRGDLAWRKKNGTDSSPGSVPEDEHAINLLARADVQRSFSSSWEPLPGTEQESMTILQFHETVFEDKADRLVLRGTAATEERLKAELPGFDVVHLATHGFFNPEGLPSMWEQAERKADLSMRIHPEGKRLTGMLPGLLSGLVLSGVGSPPDPGREDGFLTAEELLWLDLSRVKLVVLSACETGLGTPRAGEGLIGLNRSLRQAGAEAVISSLWKVDDYATQRLFAEFYKHLWIDKMGAAEALRRAKLDMLHGKILPGKEGKERGFEKPIRKTQDYSHPYYWASFVYWSAADQP